MRLRNNTNLDDKMELQLEKQRSLKRMVKDDSM